MSMIQTADTHAYPHTHAWTYPRVGRGCRSLWHTTDREFSLEIIYWEAAGYFLYFWVHVFLASAASAYYTIPRKQVLFIAVNLEQSLTSGSCAKKLLALRSWRCINVILCAYLQTDWWALLCFISIHVFALKLSVENMFAYC